MKYISINLYRKMLDCAFAEGMSRDDFINLPTFMDRLDGIQAVPADHFSTLHEMLDIAFETGFSEQSAFNRAFRR